MPQLERMLEIKLSIKARNLGLECYKLNSYSSRGLPDRIIIGSKIGFMEVKRPGGKLSELQELFIKRMQLRGHPIAVIDNLKDGIEFLESLT